MSLKSLDKFNAERALAWQELNDDTPRKNGIACPKCGNELLDSSPRTTLTSNPPQKRVHCANCMYVGHRIV